MTLRKLAVVTSSVLAMSVVFCSTARCGHWYICVDAGHGGGDAGTNCYGGANEKDLNLSLALKLQSYLISDIQFSVIMTRTTDEYLTPSQRVQISNDHYVDAFVSVHHNYPPEPRTMGIYCDSLKQETIWPVSANLAYEVGMGVYYEFSIDRLIGWAGTREDSTLGRGGHFCRVLFDNEAPATLIETTSVCYDYEYLDFVDAARGYFYGLCDFFGTTGIGTSLQASGGCTEVILTWTDFDKYYGEEVTYAISRADTCPGPFSLIDEIAWDDPSFTPDSTNYAYADISVGYSREYLYKLTVISTGEEDTDWAVPTCLPLPSVPSTPTNLSGSAGWSDGSPYVDLNWDASTGDVDGYYVYRRSFAPISGCDEVSYCGNTDQASLRTYGVTPGLAYYYGVRAFNSSGVTPLSDQCCVVVPFAGPQVITGDVDVSTTWPTTEFYQSVLVDDSLAVAAGCTLTVKPGTLVYFHGDSNDLLKINGHLIADASDTTAITFMSVDSLPSAGDWYGIVTGRDSSTVTLKNCTIKHANHGVSVITQAPFQSTIEDCTFESNLVRHVCVWGDNANLDIKKCRLSGSCPTGIFLNWIGGASADVLVEGCEIVGDSYATYGILIESGSPMIRDNVISGYSTGAAIKAYNLSTPTVRGDTLSVCKYGLQTADSASPSLLASGSPSLIDDCTVGVYTQGSSGPSFAGGNRIHDCATGVHARDTSDPSFRNTLFDSCTTYSVRVDFAAEPDLGTTDSAGSNSFYQGGDCPTYRHVYAPSTRPFGAGDVMAEMNWWGTSSPASNCFRGLVDYTPYLSSDPNDADAFTPTTKEMLIRPAVWQNYPNPFGVVTLINYQVPNGGAHVLLRVFDAMGRLVATLIDKKQPPGTHQVSWNAHNGDGRIMPAGIYFCNIEIGDEFKATRKMTLAR